MLWLGTLAPLIRYGLHNAFHHLAVHRGIWHSILAAAFSAVATTIIFAYVLDKPDGVAWLAGGFLFVGLPRASHAGRDVLGRRHGHAHQVVVRNRSQALVTGGTLMPPVSMASALALAIFLAPSPQMFVEGMSSRPMWTALNQRLLPTDSWFGLGPALSRIAGQPAPPADITTGTLPPPTVVAPEANPATSAPAGQ